MFDLDLIKKYYKNIDKRISEIRSKIKTPLTLSEKILYSHINNDVELFSRGEDYVDSETVEG